MKTYFSFFFFLIISSGHSQSDVPLTLRAQFNGSYGYTIIGNTHNEFDNWLIPTPPCQMLTQSSSILNLQPNQNIVKAYLYWSGIGDGTFDTNIIFNNIQIVPMEINVSFPESNPVFSYFGACTDVTNIINTAGNGTYTFSQLNLNPILSTYCSNSIYYSGWHVIIIYQQNDLPNNQLNLFDGFNIVNNQFNNGTTSLNINNLNVVSTDDAKMTYVAWNGSPNLFANESIAFNNNILSNALNPANNPFNGTNSFTGSTTNWNQDIDTFDISPFINIGDSQANITITSLAIRTLQTLITSIRSELPDATISINQTTGQEICGNRNLLVDYTVANTNSNAVLPANANVSFYAANTFLQTVVTPTPIAIGGSLNLQTTVNIPLSIPDNFFLKIIVDNNNTNLSQIAESNETNNENDFSVNLSPTTLITPNFTQVNPICNGQTLNTLPTTATNGISGTWLPALNNLQTTEYTFTPAAGQCANSTTLTITVNPLINPTFAPVNPICSGATLSALPIVSTNNISGTWLPALNNLQTTTYTFTPATDQCATTSSLTIEVSPSLQPNFIDVSLCQNDSSFVLNTISPNGISGSWLPTVVDFTTTGTYTFTPTISICAIPQTITITINQSTLTDFDVEISHPFTENATITIITNSSGNYLYQLDFGPIQTLNIFQNVSSGIHSVTVYQENGCATLITKNDIVIIYYPQFFTPNGDGFNDTWKIDDLFLQPNTPIYIFDRYGKLLKQISTYGNGWDGTYNGQNMPSDSYWFTVDYLFNNSQKKFSAPFALKR